MQLVQTFAHPFQPSSLIHVFQLSRNPESCPRKEGSSSRLQSSHSTHLAQSVVLASPTSRAAERFLSASASARSHSPSGSAVRPLNCYGTALGLLSFQCNPVIVRPRSGTNSQTVRPMTQKKGTVPRGGPLSIFPLIRCDAPPFCSPVVLRRLTSTTPLPMLSVNHCA